MSKFKKFMKDYAFIIACVAIISSTFIFSYKVCAVSGQSMTPTLSDGEIVFMKTDVSELERYEVAVFNNEKTEGNFIKRVIGLPGETLYMEDNTIYVNGEPIEDVVDVNMSYYGYLEDGVTLGENEYFLMGDNRNNSYDCRNIGPVKLSDIKGRVTFSISKLSKIETKGDNLS